MDTYFIVNFIKNYFTGVTNVDFFELRDTRQILIHFKDKESWNDNVNKEKLQGTVDLYLLDRENLDLMVDRDKLETVMFLTASQGAIGAVINEYVQNNKPEEEDYEELKDEQEEN
jgi:hypothetical protein